MALSKQYEVPQGVIGEHHKIQKIEIIPSENRVDILFAVYLSKEARDLEKVPLYYQSVSIPLDNFTEDPRTVFYTAARLHVNSYLARSANEVAADQSTNIGNVISLRSEYIAPYPSLFN